MGNPLNEPLNQGAVVEDLDGSYDQLLCASLTVLGKAIAAGVGGNEIADIAEAQRREHGKGVLVVDIAIRDEGDAAALRGGDFPPSCDREGGIRTFWLDSPSALQVFTPHVGAERAGELADEVGRMIQESDYSRFQPFGICLRLTLLDRQDLCPSLLGFSKAPWLAREEDVVPSKGITHAVVRKRLAGKRLAILDMRDPDCAGENVNVWMDVAKELNVQVIVSSETTAATRKMAPRHAQNTVRISLDKKPEGFKP